MSFKKNKTPCLLKSGIAAAVILSSSTVLQGATVTELTEAAQSVGGKPGADVPPDKRPVVLVCVGLNNKATGQDDPGAPPTQQQIEANLTADESDLLRRCADVIQAGGLGIQAQEATPEDNLEASVALQQIAPDEIAAQGTTSVSVANSQQSNVAARIVALQSGIRGLSLRRLSLRGSDSMLAGDDLQKLAGGAAGEGDANSRLGLFVSGDVGFGNKDATTRAAGFDFDSQSLTVGVDYFLNTASFVGVALGLNKVNMDIDGNGGGLDTDNVSLSVYGSVFRKNNFYVNGFLDYSSSSYDSTRNLNYTLDKTTGGCCVVTESGRVTVAQAANGSTDGNQTTLSLNMGHDWNKGALTYGPSLDLTYTSLTIDSFSETMSNPAAVGRGLALTFMKQDIDSFRSVLGFKVNRASSQSWGIFSQQLRVNWHHEFKDDARSIQSFYKFDPAKTLMTLKADDTDPDFYSVAVDLSAGLSRGRSAFVSYAALLGLDNISANQLNAGMRFEF